jgi:hypothetical protein
MRKYLLAALFIFVITGFAAAQVGPGRTMYVAVKSVDLKASAGKIAGTKATLSYGDQVTVVQVDGKMVEVKSDKDASLNGWTALTNLSTKKIASGASTSASVSEVALAGKGFSRENEDTYKSQGELNFADVDKIETITVNEDDLKRFVEEGGLAAAE